MYWDVWGIGIWGYMGPLGPYKMKKILKNCALGFCGDRAHYKMEKYPRTTPENHRKPNYTQHYPTIPFSSIHVHAVPYDSIIDIHHLTLIIG